MLLSFTIAAALETAPVPHAGDAADDAAVWVHPTDVAQSTIVATDKDGGLAVYDLSGKQLRYHADGAMNNVDVRYNFALGGAKVALVTASNRSDNSIAVYKVNPATRELENVAARTLTTGLGAIYGLAMYQSAASGKTYTFAVDKDSGVVEQWELFDNGAGKVDARRVRSFDVGGQSEGMVADDELGRFYVAEEAGGVYRYGAEPTAGSTRTKIASVGSQLTADVEGLALYRAANGTGYLIASSQGSDDFAVFDRGGENGFVTRFSIGAGVVDGVTDTDGIEVQSFGLGGAFAKGVFVAQDGSNSGANQNFKLVSWEAIANGDPAAKLLVDTTQDPRVAPSQVTPAPTTTPTPTPTRRPRRPRRPHPHPRPHRRPPAA